MEREVNSKPFFQCGTVSDMKAYLGNYVPAVTRLANGELLAVWSVRPDPRVSRIVGAFSSDNGATWSNPKTLVEKTEADAAFHIGDPCLLVTPSGKVVLFYLHWRGLKDSRIARRESLDNGRTWRPAVEVETSHKYNDLNRNGIVLSDRKTLVQGFSWEKRADRGEETMGETDQLYACSILRSTDDGENWLKGGDIIFDEATGVDEPTVVELANGDLYMLMRSGVGWLYQATSSDKGETWTKTTATTLDSPNAPAMLYRLSSKPSKVLVVWDNSPPAGRWIAPGKVEGTIHEPRYPLDVAISYDDCKTWSYSRTLANPGRQVSYPSVTLTTDGYILAVWQEVMAEPNRRDIKYAKFNEEWVKGGQRWIRMKA